MIKKTLNIGFLLGFFGFIYWVFSTIHIPYSRTIIIIMDILAVLLWTYLNYTSFSSSRNSGESLLLKITQLYTIPILVLIIGIVGKYFNINILSMIFLIYFLPFVDILVVFLNNFINIRNHLIAPFFVMIIITLITLYFYKAKTLKKKYS